MPTYKPGSTPRSFPTYAVVGMYSQSGAANFIQHVALLRAGQPIQQGDEVEIWHVGPPVIVGEQSLALSGQNAVCSAHVIGEADLSVEEEEGIKTWLEIVDKERRSYTRRGIVYEHYVVKPHMEEIRATESGVVIRRQFSCAGFVFECYRSIGIKLICSPEDLLPEASLETVVSTYPHAEDEERRTRLGMAGSGPWRIMLAGYILHAMKRSSTQIRSAPHFPEGVDEACFA